MARITQFAPEVRVFRWNANLPTNASCGGVVVIRATTTFLFRSQISPKIEHLITAPYSTTKQPPFSDLNSTKKLLIEVIQQIPFLRPCENIKTVVHKLAEDLFCKFRFSPKISSSNSNRGNPPKLVVLLDLETVVSTENPNYVDKLDMHRSIWENEQLRKALEDDEGMIPVEIKEVEDFLEGVGGRIEAFVPKGLDEEIKPAVEIKVFAADDDSQAEEVLCSICLDKLSVGVVAETSCSHMFHKACVSEWLVGTNSSCPMCRSSFGITV
ncbi:OLC1v1010156C1 [Oldenlandia corymbosa var. corymbosa]|uniref:OLC1v1010156C1 n=1 Tax=Oldenlandia corymbosa var. corymbosa TaxID=529605 RepID=A0AAV1DSB3_OLDCO|nr:OLC1v1010156C1 [Oldenlandia corymbosa var. corymbosa]